MSVSIQKNIKNCKIDTSWAERIQSDRFENPANMSCPIWSGRDLMGRSVSEDSFYTKSAGCNTPQDRISVENTLRPQYMEQITTDALGFRSNLYKTIQNPPSCPNTKASSIPFFSDAPICTKCTLYPYDWNDEPIALIASYSRHAQTLQHKMKAREKLLLSGFY